MSGVRDNARQPKEGGSACSSVGELDRVAYITVASKLELQLDRLFQSFESPVAGTASQKLDEMVQVLRPSYHSLLSCSIGGKPRNSSTASSGFSIFICFAL